MSINNQVYKDLLKNKLIKKSKIDVISSKTRNAHIKVLKDKVSKIIFLEKIITSKNYYRENYKSNLKKGRFFSETKFLNGKRIINKRINDDNRRIKEFIKYIRNKDICDFGCGFGGFLMKSRKIAKSITGIEIGNNCREFLSKNRIKNYQYINEISKKFDLITLFHTLHYIPNQIEILKELKKRINKKGKIIIEVPHAKDFLLQDKALPGFKDFTFCKESLIWHTEKSLIKFLKVTGYKNIRMIYYQRYGIDNHFGWYLYNKPGGHNFMNKKIDDKLRNSYNQFIIDNKSTDTLIAIAEV